MFTEYYGFSDEPFRLSPDPRFCYRHPTFAKGGAYMRYALRAAEGFVVITGSPGMGKTTLISDTTHSFGPGEYTVATMVNTLLAPDDVLRSAAYEFGLDADGVDTATVLHRLKQFFIHCHARKRPPLLVVDEAQNLSLYALEELRMLTNLEFDGRPLLQIFLVGQNQLRDNLQHPGLEQLRQRVTAAAHLKALNDDEVAGYLMHRLKVVGWRGSPKLKSSCCRSSSQPARVCPGASTSSVTAFSFTVRSMSVACSMPRSPGSCSPRCRTSVSIRARASTGSPNGVSVGNDAWVP
jgi:general secretion pathway protein A